MNASSYGGRMAHSVYISKGVWSKWVGCVSHILIDRNNVSPILESPARYIPPNGKCHRLREDTSLLTSHIRYRMTLKIKSRSPKFELGREPPKMHLCAEYEGCMTISARVITKWRCGQTVQNDLEKVGQGHPSLNLSESLPRYTYVVNMKDIQ